jgi:hypothetical protein
MPCTRPRSSNEPWANRPPLSRCRRAAVRERPAASTPDADRLEWPRRPQQTVVFVVLTSRLRPKRPSGPRRTTDCRRTKQHHPAMNTEKPQEPRRERSEVFRFFRRYNVAVHQRRRASAQAAGNRSAVRARRGTTSRGRLGDGGATPRPTAEYLTRGRPRPAPERRPRAAVWCNRVLDGSVDHRRHKRPRPCGRASALPDSCRDVAPVPHTQANPTEQLGGTRVPRCTGARPGAP